MDFLKITVFFNYLGFKTTNCLVSFKMKTKTKGKNV